VKRYADKFVEERFNNYLEQYEKSPQDRDSGTVMDYSTDQYKAAFHRAVVDHWVFAKKHEFLGDTYIEGLSILRQAEIICAGIDELFGRFA
jgi:hypothetical protein